MKYLMLFRYEVITKVLHRGSILNATFVAADAVDSSYLREKDCDSGFFSRMLHWSVPKSSTDFPLVGYRASCFVK